MEPLRDSAVQWAELRNLVMHYPVQPGDTLSHSSMNRLAALKLATRNSVGAWIPTAAGVARFNAGPQIGDRGTRSW